MSHKFVYSCCRFRATGWNVITVKYGKELLKLFAEPVGGKGLKRWIREVDNGLYGSLVFRGGKAFRDQIAKDTNNDPDVTALMAKFNDEELSKVLSNLGGHCMEVCFIYCFMYLIYDYNTFIL
jgi:pyruvate dehydrogenase E1 component